MSIRFWIKKKWHEFQHWRNINGYIISEFKSHPQNVICPECGASMHSYFPGKTPDLRMLISSCPDWKCGTRVQARWNEDRGCWGSRVRIGFWGNEIREKGPK